MSTLNYTGAPASPPLGELVPPKISLTEGSIPRALLALPFMGGLFFLMAVLRGAGDSKTPFIYLAMSVALDIALNPLLIFGRGPIPRLGIAGSAIATLSAQALSFFALVVHLYGTKHFLCIHRNELSLFLPATGAALALSAHLNAIAYHRFGGWRTARLGVANRRAAPLPSL